MGKTVTDVANELLRNIATAVPLKYLINFWRSLKMRLINCKVERKPRWTDHCALSSVGADNDNANSNNIISNNIILKQKMFL